MKVTHFMGEQDLRSVVLSPRDVAVLGHAADVLDALRAHFGDDDGDLATDVALAGHTCRELAEAVRVDLP